MPRLKYGISAALAAVALLASCTESRTPGEHGAACSAEVPCAGGLLCVSASTFPGGYCSTDCGSTACGAGGICDREMSPALCLAVCESDSECRDGYQCWRGACRARCDVVPSVCGADVTCDAEGHCVGGECTVDSECGAGRRCEAGTCVVVVPPGDGGGELTNGAPCSADTQCASALCLP
ncbi:MAG: hypothetical protein M3Y87_36330, partial [Myxococcota bacterium]|nr:hypothetical protein [Myxococcota bacterium]